MNHNDNIINMHIIISGPSGVGKTTIINKLLDKIPSWRLSKSTTTRSIRHEDDHKEYDFISIEEFKNKINNKEFYEHAKVYDNYYGTLNKYLDRSSTTIFNINVEGALKFINSDHNGPILSIFILPPSISELANRLHNRNTKEDNLELRLKTATAEIIQGSKFDYVIVNDNIDDSIAKIISCYCLTSDKIRYEMMLSYL